MASFKRPKEDVRLMSKHMLYHNQLLTRQYYLRYYFEALELQMCFLTYSNNLQFSDDLYTLTFLQDSDVCRFSGCVQISEETLYKLQVEHSVDKIG